jgi:hypothetical protein
VRIIQQISLPLVDKTDRSDRYAIPGQFIREYLDTLGRVDRSGVIQIGFCPDGSVCDDVRIVSRTLGDHREAVSLYGLRACGVIVPVPQMNDDLLFTDSWASLYRAVVEDPTVGMVVLFPGSHEFDRIRFLKTLGRSGLFATDKQHILYGFHNPAELAVYRHCFGSHIHSKLTMAVCSVSFIYGMFNTRLSERVGVVHQIPEVYCCRHTDLGMLRWYTMDMDFDQRSTFNYNCEVVHGFMDGYYGQEYVDYARKVVGGDLL